MRSTRLSLALDQGILPLPPQGRILVLNPAGTDDLSALPRERLQAVQGFRPDHDALAARGIAVSPDLPEGDFAAAIVCMPRSRAQARALVAAACAAVGPGGPVAVDGQKDDGIDSLLKDIRARAPLGEPLAKAHGRLAVLPAGPWFADWHDSPRDVGGLVTRAGVFSADGPDPGSALLAAALPAQMKGRGVDLGAGWGFLSAAVLAREGVKTLDVVEADHTALDCARRNVTDPRAAFHWADATRFRPARPADFVVMNPPFHSGRAADPALGQAFLTAAAAMLAPDGTLWLVANRALPYDRVLNTLFRHVEDLPGLPAYRLTRAGHPIRHKGPA